MSIKLSDLAAKTREIAVTYEGERVVVSYRPSRFTPIMAARMQDVQDAKHPTLAFAEALADLLEKWDILDDKGKPIQPTADFIGQLPMDLLSLIGNEVVADMNPKATNGAGLPATS